MAAPPAHSCPPVAGVQHFPDGEFRELPSPIASPPDGEADGKVQEIPQAPEAVERRRMPGRAGSIKRFGNMPNGEKTKGTET
jgi:hypothetical protein